MGVVPLGDIYDLFTDTTVISKYLGLLWNILIPSTISKHSKYSPLAFLKLFGALRISVPVVFVRLFL